MLPTVHSTPRTRRYSKLQATQGGNSSPIAQHPDIRNADLTMVFDTQNELARLFPQDVPPDVKLFPLGQGHTARTLAERAPQAIQRCINSAAGMNADSGLGQHRAIGYLATQLLLDSREMRSFIEGELHDSLMRASGGVLDHVRIEGKGSVAGGTASAGLLLTVAALEKTILDRSNATAETIMTLTGGISYHGLGYRVHCNTVAGVVEALAYVTSRRQPTRAIRSLRLMELPPVGEDHEERARYMLEVEQASQCAEVSDTLDRIGPNNSQNGPLGNVSLWRSVHFTPLHPRFHVARDIAPEYCLLLRQLLAESKPQPSLIRRLVLNARRQPLPREDLDGILTRTETTPATELVEAVAQLGTKTTATVDATLASGELLRLSEAQNVWATAPKDMAETQARLVLQNTCLQVLDREITTLETQVAVAELQRDAQAHHCARTVEKIQRPGPWARAGQLLGNNSPLPDQLALTAQQLRNLADQIHQSKSELQALRHARRLVETERDYLVSRINAITMRLDMLVPRSQQHRSEPTVVAKPLDAVFAKLWAITAETTEEQVSRVLISAVDHVTVRGLAEITSATPPRLEVVAANIAHHRGVMTPPWGGKPRMLDGQVIHVLPPLSRETGDKLKEMIKNHSPASIVAVAEQMPASINCTTLIITPVNDIEDDIFTQYLQNSLLEAYREENRDMYFPSGTAALDELGIVIDGNEVKFLNKTLTQQRTRQ